MPLRGKLTNHRGETTLSMSRETFISLKREAIFSVHLFSRSEKGKGAKEGEEEGYQFQRVFSLFLP